MAHFQIEDLNFSYPTAKGKKSLDGVNLTVEKGEYVVLCGASGSGKTTLLRHLKPVLTPHGKRSGQIRFDGVPLEQVSQRDQAAKIGYVMQNPDDQIVTDKVWHELAFGLESLGMDTPSIRRRVAEMASFFGIEKWFYKNVSELSGGQKQLLNLASIMVMQPSVLILDEPTSQLDPIAASDFLSTLGRINRELGTTVIIVEQRLEEALPLSSRVIVMDGGKLICDGTPAEAGRALREHSHSMFLAMPAPMRIYSAVPNDLDCPVTVRDGRNWLTEYSSSHSLSPIPEEKSYPRRDTAPSVELDEVWFRYEKDSPDVLKGVSLKAYPGEFLAILGGNGAGKSTSLSLISGINKPYRGKVKIGGMAPEEHGSGLFDGLLGVLPQNPQSLFVKKTVREDLWEMLREKKLSKEVKARKVRSVAALCRLDELLERHPYDLSGGEQQRAALAKVLLLEPTVLLLDEPTKGLDAEFKLTFAAIMQKLLEHNITIIMVSHDVEFCAMYPHRCAMFFDGTIVTENTPRAFFSGNSFYTTTTNRMSRHLLPDAVTVEDAIVACGAEYDPSLPDIDIGSSDDAEDYFIQREEEKSGNKTEVKKTPLWRKLLACFSGIVAILTLIQTLELFKIPLFSLLDKTGIYITLIVSLGILAFSVGKKSDSPQPVQFESEKRKLSKRTIFATVMILVAIPITIFTGIVYLGDKKYYFISLLLIIETMLPFFMVFEGRKPKTRELVIIAVLCAIAVAGRAAFFMVPNFKPVVALVIIAGVAFGGETGFLVGAITGFVSNFFFGQGPWTPWQMFSFGIIGFLAGVLFRKGFLRRTRLSLCLFGGLTTIIVYGGIMNFSNVIIYQHTFNAAMLKMSYLTGFPMDVVHACATVIFLWIISQPMLEKLDRIKVKYGLIE